MKILQRYILIQLLKVFVLLLSVLTIMLVFLGVFQEAQDNGLGAVQIVQILPYIIPSLLPYTIPSTLLLSVCVVYGRLSGDLEVIATKSAGINPLSLLMPAFLLGIVLAVCSLFLTDRVIPWSVSRMQSIISQALEEIFLDQLRASHLIANTSDGYTISVVDVRGKTLISPIFQFSPKGNSTTTLQAQEATIHFDLEKQVVILDLKNCQIDASNQTSIYFERERREFPLPERITRFNARHVTLQNLRHRIGDIKQKKVQAEIARDVEIAFALATGDFELFSDQRIHDTDVRSTVDERLLNKMNTEIHSRFALSTSCLFFVFLGGPYAISQGKKQFLTTFFLCFLPILLLYYPVALLVMTLAKNGDVDPSWAMWIPNVILFVAGATVLRRVIQH
jgi:lipopolysaccharide export system permease protein